MKIRNISDRVIEKTESGITHVLAPGDEAPVETVANAESWENWAPGEVARVYEDGEWLPPLAPVGVLIVGLNHDGTPTGDIPTGTSDGPEARGAVDEGQDEVMAENEQPEDASEAEEPQNLNLSDLESKTRKELDDLAPHFGIDDPSAYKTKGELADAIRANAQPE